MTAAYGSSTVKRRTGAELAIIDDAIVEAIQADAPVTLRGVYYRAVSAGAVEKTEAGYRLVGRQLLKLRRAGIVPYSDITDGTRWITKPSTWSNLDQMLEDAAASYRRDLWHSQAAAVQIFTEKDAISGVILPETERWDVPLGVLRGYASESFAWSCAQSIRNAGQRGKTTYVYQLGDHDPSGVDAWRAFRKTVSGFLLEEYRSLRDRVAAAGMGSGEDLDDEDDDEDDGSSSCVFVAGEDVATVTFERLAVTEDQIEDLSLPTRPTKATDSRSRGFGGGSVEVDAIPAPTLRQIIREAITQHIEPEALSITRIAEQSERDILTRMTGGQA